MHVGVPVSSPGASKSGDGAKPRLRVGACHRMRCN